MTFEKMYETQKNAKKQIRFSYWREDEVLIFLHYFDYELHAFVVDPTAETKVV